MTFIKDKVIWQDLARAEDAAWENLNSPAGPRMTFIKDEVGWHDLARAEDAVSNNLNSPTPVEKTLPVLCTPPRLSHLG